MTSYKKNVFTICLLVFVDSVGMGLILPILPTLFIHSNYLHIFDIDKSLINLYYGITLAIFPMFSLIGMPFLGSLSDKYGRKRLLLYSVSILIMSYSLSAASIYLHDIWIFYLARALAGFASGSYAVCNAALLDSSVGDDVTMSSLRYLNISNILGFIMGPTLSVFIHVGTDFIMLITPFLIALAISIVNMILLITFYEENYHRTYVSIVRKDVSFVMTIQACMKSYRAIFLGYILFCFGFEIFLQSQPIYLASEFHYTSSNIGLFFIAMSILTNLSMFVIHPLMYNSMRLMGQTKLALIIMSSVLLLYMLLNIFMVKSSIIALWVTSSIFFITAPLITLNFTKMFSDFTSKENKGSIMGLMGQISSLFAVLGALTMSSLLYIGENINALVSGLLVLLCYLFIVSIGSNSQLVKQLTVINKVENIATAKVNATTKSSAES